MSSLLVLRDAPISAPAWECDAVPYSYHEASHVQFKAMPGLRWITTERCWRGPAEAIQIVATILESAGVCKLRDDRQLSTNGGSVRPFPAINGRELRCYQQEGVRWCASKLRLTGGALLADEMGIGKTPQAIVAVEMIAGPAQVVCPAVVVKHWESRIGEWSRAPETWPKPLSYEKFRSKPPAPCRSLIVDEGHYLANPKSKRSAAVRDWRMANADLVLATTGTPMPVRPIDLHNLLDIIHPGRWGSRGQFGRRYCDGRNVEIPNVGRAVWDDSGSSREGELAVRLQAVMLARTKAAVALELPPRTRQMIEVPIPAAARRDLRTATAAIDWASAGSGIAGLLSAVESYKIEAAVALARDAVAARQKPLLLTLRRATAREIALRLQDLGAVAVTGDDPPPKRADILNAAPIGVATLDSVTTGIDLVSFQTLVMVGLDWVPSKILQGEARIHRIGQSLPVTIYYLIGLGTVDEIVRETVISRLDTWGKISQGGDSSGLGGELAGSDDDVLAGLVAAVRGMAA